MIFCAVIWRKRGKDGKEEGKILSAVAVPVAPASPAQSPSLSPEARNKIAISKDIGNSGTAREQSVAFASGLRSYAVSKAAKVHAYPALDALEEAMGQTMESASQVTRQVSFTDRDNANVNVEYVKGKTRRVTLRYRYVPAASHHFEMALSRTIRDHLVAFSRKRKSESGAENLFSRIAEHRNQLKQAGNAINLADFDAAWCLDSSTIDATSHLKEQQDNPRSRMQQLIAKLEQARSDRSCGPPLGEGLFNVADFLFASRQLVDAFPELAENSIVTAYHSALPGMAGANWRKLVGLQKKDITLFLPDIDSEYSFSELLSFALYPWQLIRRLLTAAILHFSVQPHVVQEQSTAEGKVGDEEARSPDCTSFTKDCNNTVGSYRRILGDLELAKSSCSSSFASSESSIGGLSSVEVFGISLNVSAPIITSPNTHLPDEDEDYWDQASCFSMESSDCGSSSVSTVVSVPSVLCDAHTDSSLESDIEGIP
eukprot:gene25176-30406_t